MTSENEKSRVLTLVFTDLADSTALKTARGDRVVHDMIEAHRVHVTRLAEECAGRIVDWAGDGCFLSFETSSAGVMFGLRLQQAHADAPELPGVRIGIHMGEVSESPGPLGPQGPPRIDGLAVDIAARVSALAKPGQVLMSASVYQSARQRLGVDTFGQPIIWQAHGTHELKGVDEPMDIRGAGLEHPSPSQALGITDEAVPLSEGDPGRYAMTQDEADAEARRSYESLQKTFEKHFDEGRIPSSGFMRKPESSSVGGSPRLATIRWVVLAVVIVGTVALAYSFGRRQTSPDTDGALPTATSDIGPITSLAVLPLDNMSGDPQQDYFADSMTEAITAELAKIKALTVRGRTSAMQFRGSDMSIPEIAAALKVDALIEGSVLRDGDDVRVTVQLVHGSSDAHVWSESYTNTMESIFQLQSEVALAIADAISAELTGEERERIASAQTVDPEAYEAYLLGEYFDQDRTEESLERAREQFERAVEIDPGFAEAWARLGDSYRVRSTLGWAPEADMIPPARSAYLKALTLDSSLALAHTGLAHIAFAHDREWAQAEERFQIALELSPNDADTHNDYAAFLAAAGRAQEALRHAQTALDLDPGDPEEVMDGSVAIQLAGELKQGVGVLERLLTERPDYAAAWNEIDRAYIRLGMHDEAVAAAEHVIEFGDRSAESLLNLAETVAFAGDKARAEALVREALETGKFFRNIRMAWAQLSLGNLDESFEWFDKAVEAREWGTVWLRQTNYWAGSVRPLEDEFFSDPRYWDLIERMKFPPLPPEHPGYEAEQAWLARKAAAEEANAPIRTIAVLPFENMMRDAEQEYFVDGMTEALITELAQIKSLQVRGRTSVMQYKGTTKTIPEIARELDVDGIIEGSVMREGDEVRITAQLIHGPSDTHRWARSFDSTVTSIFKLHSEMALAIVREVQANLSPDERTRLSVVPSINARAYDQYLRGQIASYEQSEEGNIQARRYYARAIEIDPEFADPYASMGTAIWATSIWGWSDAREEIDEAKSLIQKALELDDRSANAHLSAGFFALGYDYDWERAETHFRISVELNPDNFLAHHGVSWGNLVAGRYEEGIREGRMSAELDPFNPQALDAVSDGYSMSGQYGNAIRDRKNTLELSPDHAGTLMNLSDDYLCAGMYEDALATYRRVLAVRGVEADAGLAAILAFAGEEVEARALLEKEIARSAEEFVPAFRIALAYVALRESDAALTWLERAYEQRPWNMIQIDSWFAPLFAPIRDEPRFQAILDKMNFPEPLAR